MRLVVATFGPRMPYVTTRDGADQGPAGSLVQTRERTRVLRRASRPAAVRDWRLWVGWVVVVVLALFLLDSGGVGGLVLGALDAGVALVLLYPRYRPGVLEAELSRQIGRERRVARELEPLRGLGWTVLHDRVLPYTEPPARSTCWPARAGCSWSPCCRWPARCCAATARCGLVARR
jgi:hypothetical protein